MTTKHEPAVVCAGYLFPLFHPDRLNHAIELSVGILSEYDYDTLAFTGVSGAIIGTALSLATGKYMLAVRKDTDTVNHSTWMVEGNHGSERYIIVDDTVSSGSTASRIFRKIEVVAPNAICLGVLEIADILAYPAKRIPLNTDWMPSEHMDRLYNLRVRK